MKKSAIISIIVVGLLALTCPNAEEHKEKITEQINLAIQDKVDEATGVGFLGGLVSTATDAIVDKYIDNSLEVNSYGVCSVGRMKVDGEMRTVSFGIFNHIFTFDKEDVKKNIDKALGGE